MALTKQDFELIAQIISKGKEFYPEATEAIDTVTMMLTGAFSQVNPRFKADTFLTAANHRSKNENN